MVIMKTCCCDFFTVRTGSFCAAFFGSGYFTVNLLASSLQRSELDAALATTPPDGQGSAAVGSLVLMVLCPAGLASTVLLIVGLVKGCRWLLLPLVVVLSATVIVDFGTVSAIILQDLIVYHTTDVLTAFLFLVDICVLSINVLCILCVVSQFQVYSASPSDSANAGGRSPPLTLAADQSTQPGLSAAPISTSADADGKGPPDGATTTRV
ncbi:uncharacterized protein LOC119108480 [Pollicipes pollicipes]|uniref:uncharacterized protein LOC119108480 n=1 Tax=Pollicipes pollicipes TaxID=41117 RepID=UPI0018859D83|nr:uncharacterized protein LOC119108480 [Pollicipes pollicipes]